MAERTWGLHALARSGQVDLDLDDSTDDTALIARKAGAKVISAGGLTIGAKRNVACQNASWVSLSKCSLSRGEVG